MKNKLLSIVIPAYNVAPYIRKTILSLDKLLNRDDVEVLIINDGSTDLTSEICTDLEREFINITVFTKNNGGLSSSRNYGLSKSKGEFIYFLDGDDYLEKDAFFDVLRFIKKHTHLQILCFGYQKVDVNGNKKSKHLLNSNINEYVDLTYKKMASLMVVDPNEPIGGYIPTKIFKKELIGRTTFKNMNYEDFPFVLDLLIKKPMNIEYYNRVVYSYVQRKESIVHSLNEKNLIDKLNSLNYTESILEKLNLDAEDYDANNLRNLIAVLWVSSLNLKLRCKIVFKNALKQLLYLKKWGLKSNKVSIFMKFKLLVYIVVNTLGSSV